MIKKLAAAAAVVVAMLLVALALWQMREAVQLLLIALTVGAGLGPTVERLSARGIRRERAIGLVLLATIALIGLAFAGVGSRILTELEQAAGALPAWYDMARRALAAQGGWVAGVARDLPPGIGLLSRLIDADALAALLMDLATRLMVGAVLVLSAVSLGSYWLIDQTRIERFWLSLLPLQARNRVRRVWTRVYQEVGCYVRAEAALSLLTAAGLLAVYWLIGLPGAMLLAIVGGGAVIVPILGPALALLPPLIVALATGRPGALVAVAAAAGLIALIKGLVAPRLFRQGVAVNPVLSVVCIMALSEVGGVWLILLGPPLAAAIQSAVQATREEQASAAPLPGDGPDAIQLLHGRLDRIAIASPPDDPQVGSLIGRARRLVSAADEIFDHG